MSGRPFFAFVLLLFCCAGPPLAHADLGDLKKGVEQEEKDKKDEKTPTPEAPEPEKKPKTEEEREQERRDNQFWGAFWGALGVAWFTHNLSVTYDDFPYAHGSRFLSYRTADGGDQDAGFGKFFRLDVSAEDWYAGSMGNGLRVALRGKLIPLLGPELETSRLWDGQNAFENTLIGANLSLFQTDLLSADTYLQAAWLHGILERSGAAFGLSFQSYPFPPLSVSARLGVQVYENFSFGEASLQLGYVLDRLEFYAGWRSLEAQYTGLSGPFAGTKVNF